MSDTGIEPATSSVSGKRATAAPIAHAYSVILRGEDGIRTRVDGFAGRCLASRPPHHRGSRLREYPNGGIPSGEKPAPEGTSTRADDEIRTRDPHLGKVMRYHCATSAWSDLSHTGVVRPALAATRKLYPVHAVSPKPVPFTGRVPRVHADRRGLHGPPGRPPGQRRARQTDGVPTTAGHPLLSIRTQVRRAIGAVGSALRSHRRGHQFESGIAHLPVPRKQNTRRARRHRVGLFASRHPCRRGPCTHEPVAPEPEPRPVRPPGAA